MVKVVLDTLGSDAGCEELVKGAVIALNKFTDLSLVLSGPKDEIEKVLNNSSYDASRLEIIDASLAITNNDVPTVAIKQKTESSLVKAIDYINQSDTECALVSCGSTGAVLCGAVLKFKRVARIRPTLACMLPNQAGGLFCLTDCGANVDCKTEQLVEFAKMGNAFCKSYLKIDNPRVGLLSNGSEDKKGNTLTKEVFGILKESDLNFVGNIEGSAVLNGLTDVLVCDGFDGNIILKNIEGTAKTIIKELVVMMKKEPDEVKRLAIGQAINNILNKYDFNSLGGAMILGVNKVVVKGHGAANKDTVVNTILQAMNLVKCDLTKQIEASFK